MKKVLFVILLLALSATGSYSQDIFRTVMRGDLEQTKTLLEEDPDLLNAKSWGGWTPLHRAAQFGHVDIVDFLISKGGDIEARTNLDVTPLFAAIIGPRPEVVRQLIGKGADVSAVRSDGESLLHIAAAVGQKDIVEMLIEAGSEVDAVKRYGVTPLHTASVFGQKDAAEALLSHGAEIDRKNDNGSTALHLALAAGEAETAALLREKGASRAPEEYRRITGEYLGKKRPGSTPESFAPDILFSTHRPHGSIAFSPDGREIYWVAALGYGQFQKIWMTRREGDRWTAPEAVTFPDPHTYGGPAFSPDGKRFFFDVHKPSGPDDGGRDHDIWFRERNTPGWSDVVKPGPPLNSEYSELGPSVSRNGNMYFYSMNKESGFGSIDIYFSRLTEDGYEEPENLGGSINTQYPDTAPFIAPDESYLLFSSMRPDGHGDFDLYVSYRNKDGSWAEAQNMGETVNSAARESVSVVSPDGRYLFFMSRRNRIGEFFWVDAKIIEDLKQADTVQD